MLQLLDDVLELVGDELGKRQADRQVHLGAQHPSCAPDDRVGAARPRDVEVRLDAHAYVLRLRQAIALSPERRRLVVHVRHVAREHGRHVQRRKKRLGCLCVGAWSHADNCDHDDE